MKKKIRIGLRHWLMRPNTYHGYKPYAWLFPEYEFKPVLQAWLTQQAERARRRLHMDLCFLAKTDWRKMTSLPCIYIYSIFVAKWHACSRIADWHSQQKQDKMILCEKPLARTVAEAKLCSMRSAKADVKNTALATNYRRVPAVDFGQEYVGSGQRVKNFFITAAKLPSRLRRIQSRLPTRRRWIVEAGCGSKAGGQGDRDLLAQLHLIRDVLNGGIKDVSAMTRLYQRDGFTTATVQYKKLGSMMLCIFPWSF